MPFPSRELSNKYISASYQDVLQQYPASGSNYILDGLGNVVAVLNAASIGDVIITSNMTSSMSVISASYAVSYSYSDIIIVSSSFSSASLSASYALTASYVSGSSDSSVSASYSFSSSAAEIASYSLSSSISNVSIYSDTASLSIYSDFSATSSVSADAISASYTLQAVSASHAATASYVYGGTPIKSGEILSSSFGGDISLTSSVTFSTPFGSGYSLSVIGEEPRIITVESKSLSGFTLNTNSNVPLSGGVYWQAVQYGEYN
jgi:hypothetical protein